MSALLAANGWSSAWPGRAVPGVEDYYQKAVEYVQQSIDPNTGRLHKAKSTDNSRMILALTALGRDVTKA